MNIKPINNFNILQSSKVNNWGLFKVSNPNLAPLQKDTVSFSGRSELVAENMSDAPQVKICKSVEENAVGACYYLYSVLDKYLSDIAEFKPSDKILSALNMKQKSKSKQSDAKFATFEMRIKSASSIREKVVSRYAKLHKKEHQDFADELLDKLVQYFPINKGEKKSKIVATIKNYTKNSATGQKTSAYLNAQNFVTTTVKNLRNSNILDFSGYSEEDINRIVKSISTDMGSKSSGLVSDGKFADPKTINGIKHYSQDTVGARIILHDGSKENTDKLIAALQKAVDDGVLKIKSIENYIPSEDKIPAGKTAYDYSYASDKQLNILEKVSGAPLLTQKSQTGYIALHINVDLSDPIFKNYNGIYNGYSGEIQIIGRDVEQLKKVEDLCYKFKDNKNAVNIAYKPFKDYFLKYYKDDTIKAFDDYTYALYIAQRDFSKKRRSNSFPTIEELGFANKVPKALDFNRLKTIYEGCRSIAESNETEIIKKPSSEKDIIAAGNFKTIKKLIENKINN